MAGLVVVIGTGTAGSQIVKTLLEAGDRVRAIDFSRGQLDKLTGTPAQPRQLERQQGDATDAKSMAQCLAGAESVILAFQGGGYLSAGKVDHGVSHIMCGTPGLCIHMLP